MEVAITIRTLLQAGRRVSVQAGAGLVFDSKPDAEYRETVSKAQALFAAVAQAQTRTLYESGGAPRSRLAKSLKARGKRAKATGKVTGAKSLAEKAPRKGQP